MYTSALSFTYHQKPPNAQHQYGRQPALPSLLPESMACKWPHDRPFPRPAYAVRLPAMKSAKFYHFHFGFWVSVSVHLLNSVHRTYRIVQLLIGDFSNGVGQWTIMDDGHFAALSGEHMTIDGIVACIQISADVPLGEWWIIVVQHFFEWFIPMHHVCTDFAPKFFWFFDRTQILVRIHWICARGNAIYAIEKRRKKNQREKTRLNEMKKKKEEKRISWYHDSAHNSPFVRWK